MGLSEQELKRYNRQMMIEGWGEATQKKLKGSTVFIAGAGGSGRRSPSISRSRVWGACASAISTRRTGRT